MPELVKVFGPALVFLPLMWILLREQLKSHSDRMTDKDKQLDAANAKKDQLVQDIVKTFETKLTEMSSGAAARAREDRAENRENLTQVLTHCQREATVLTAAVAKEFEALRAAIAQRQEERS